MRYRRFGRTGVEVSEVSLGGAYLGGSDPERAEENAREIVARAAELQPERGALAWAECGVARCEGVGPAAAAAAASMEGAGLE